jgi:hypothetical protein
MPKLLAKVAICILIAALITMIVAAVYYFASWPPRWNHPEWAWPSALLGMIYCAAVPLFLLGVWSLRRIPSTANCVLVTVSWLFLAFLLRAQHPWTYYGQFPWWMLERDFFLPIPIALAAGLSFGIAARRIMGPNNSFKPNPLRGSA